MVLAQFYDEEKKLRVIVSDFTTINGFQTVEADSHGSRGYVVSDSSDFTATDLNCGGRLHGASGYVVSDLSDFTATELRKSLVLKLWNLNPKMGGDTVEADSHGTRGYVISDLSDFTATDLGNTIGLKL
ncbi:hypothetical protein CEXT_597791 [Caerostris extrusa]|uniref:Uncharacterized protein n=1 Tax=Caerostris extrusa TaxID=172846 RepID=A0AAV4X4S7_CAEEX|nr:hypothetical protein CEXT_597791 [Caerostris extrusa]